MLLLDKKFSYSLYLASLLFLVLYFILSFNARLAGDDFFYLWLKNTFGAWQGMVYQYDHWSGRWTAHFIGCALLEYWKSPWLLPILNIFTFFSLFLALKINIKTVLNFSNIDLNGDIVNPITIILISALFFTSYHIGETWFWFIIIITYLWSIIAFLLLLHFLFTPGNKFSDFTGIVLTAIFIGGASESFALIFLSLLSFILIFRYKKLHIAFSNMTNIKLFTAIIVLAVSFSFSAFAPGTEIRHSLLPHTSIPEKIIIILKSYAKFFIRYLPGKIFYLILFSTPWLLLGAMIPKDRFTHSQLYKYFKRVTFFFLAAIFIMYVPTSMVMSEAGPDRALSVISFTTVFYFAFMFFIAGLVSKIRQPQLRDVSIAFAVFSSLIMLIHIYIQYSKGNAFTKAYDERMQLIQHATQNNFTGVLELKKMPDVGMLYWDEFSPDTSYFTNKHLRDGLGLHFTVKVVPEK